MISLRNNKLNLEKVFREHIWGNSCFLYKVNFKYTCIMATTNFKGQPVKLIGEFIQVGKETSQKGISVGGVISRPCLSLMGAIGGIK